jgi:hypothetical protein
MGLAGLALGVAVSRLGVGESESVARPVESPSQLAVASRHRPPAQPIEAAEHGDTQVLATLEALPAAQRTAAQTLALAAGRAVKRSAALEQLRAELAKDPSLIEQTQYRQRILEFTRDPETARPALGLIAKLDSPWSPDLLYEVWTATPARTQITSLAQALVYAKDVRPKATRALDVALALRVSKPEACEERKALLKGAVDHGDRRSLHLIGRLLRRYGCGPNRAADCHVCLRDSDLVTDAMKAVRRRPAPEL